MAVRIQSVKSAIEDNGIKILVFGRAGAGKTVLTATAGESTIILSNESGLLSIAEAPDYVKVAQIESMDDMDDMYEFLLEDAEEGEPTFKWICLDSISEIAEVCLAYEKKQSKDPRKAYGELQERMMDLLRKFRDLPHYNVVMTCKMRRQTNDEGRTFFAPMMPGQQLHQQIPYIFDEVFALRVEEDEESKEPYRVLQTDYRS
jgi:phage nucleotide-binding protein